MKLVLSVEQELFINLDKLSLINYFTPVARSVIVPQFNWYRSVGVFIHLINWLLIKLFDLFISVFYVFIVMAVSLDSTQATPSPR